MFVHFDESIFIIQVMIDGLGLEFFEENNRASAEKCERILKSCCSTVDEKIKAGTYAVPGGFKKLEAELEQVRKEYNIMSKWEEFGPKASAVLLDFEQQKVLFDFLT
jgi:hypothetical protein